MASPAMTFARCFSRNILLCLLLGTVAALAGNDETSPSGRLSVVSQAGGHFRNKHSPRFGHVVASGRGAQRQGMGVGSGEGSGKDDPAEMEFEDDGSAGANVRVPDVQLAESDDEAEDDLSTEKSTGDEVVGGKVSPTVTDTMKDTVAVEIDHNLEKMRGLEGLVVDADQDSQLAIDASKTWRQESVAALKQFPAIESSTADLQARMLAGNEAIKKDVTGDPSLQSFLVTAANRDQAIKDQSDEDSSEESSVSAGAPRL